MSLKKIAATSVDEKRSLIEPGVGIRLARQYELIGLNRSSYYYDGSGESEENLGLIKLIDEQYLKAAFYGSPRMTAVLRRMGYQVNHKRVECLMQVMGMEAIYPS